MPFGLPGKRNEMAVGWGLGGESRTVHGRKNSYFCFINMCITIDSNFSPPLHAYERKAAARSKVWH
jgi:hypothetical protein